MQAAMASAPLHFEQFAKPPPAEAAGSQSEGESALDKKPRGRPRKIPSPGPSKQAFPPAENFQRDGPQNLPTPPQKSKPELDQERGREKVEHQLKLYEQEYGQSIVLAKWNAGVTPVPELEKVKENYANQVTGLHQFQFGKMVFLKGMDNLPSVMRYVYPDMDLTDLGVIAAKNYEVIIAPTWKELIIKYDLFRFGPELRMLFIIQDLLRMVDERNKQRYQNAQAPKDSRFKEL
jgi:hypothetical protein